MTLRCLGAFDVSRGGVSISPEAWRRSAPRRLLKYLAVQNRPVHREEIAEALWPDREPRHVANQVRVALALLPQVLEPGRPARSPSSLLVTAGSTVWLARDHVVCDVDRFQASLNRAASSEGDPRWAALEDAVAAYGGDLFEDDPYEEWITALRARLVRQYLDALCALAEHEEAARRWEAALARWQGCSAVSRRPNTPTGACREVAYPG